LSALADAAQTTPIIARPGEPNKRRFVSGHDHFFRGQTRGSAADAGDQWDVRGVGYEVLIPLSSSDKLPPLGAEVRLLTHLAVRETRMCSTVS